jgi:hypothetical protein
MRHPFFAALAVALGIHGPAFALGRLAEVTIVDRDSGRSIQTHYYRGEYWIAGAPGGRYAIEVQNRGDRRLLAVTSVDGVNVVSGETASYGQSGYVFASRAGYRITGWRKSDEEVAAFEFAAPRDSYAARTGRPANVGVIGVALFREADVEVTPSVSTAPAGLPTPRPFAEDAPARWSAPLAAPVERFPAPVVQAPRLDGPQSAAPPAPGARAEVDPLAGRAASARSIEVPSLGTGHGARESSFTLHTTFARRESTPDEVIRIRYDSERKLVAMGVLPGRRLTSPAPQPFPGAPGYVPDPPE